MSKTPADQDDRDDRRILQRLPAIPDGAQVVVFVGNRELLLPSAVSWLAEASHRLNIEIEASDPDVAAHWYGALMEAL